MFNGKNILVTGGTGSFGKKLIKTILQRYKPHKLVVFSRDELKQFEMAQMFSVNDHPCMRYFIGDVRDKIAILMDDMVDTAGTLCNGAETLLKNGAREVHACCSHPVLSGPAVERISKSEIKSLVVTNSIPLSEEAKKCEKIKVLSVSALLAEAIHRIHNEDSVSSLFV